MRAAVDALKQPNHVTTEIKDEWDTFGQMVAQELRKFPAHIAFDVKCSILNYVHGELRKFMSPIPTYQETQMWAAPHTPMASISTSDVNPRGIPVANLTPLFYSNE